MSHSLTAGLARESLRPNARRGASARFAGMFLSFLLTPLLTGLSAGAETSLTPDSAVLAMLNNIKENGFDPNSEINDGLGGLWINWRYGTSPLQVNFNGSGSPDGPSVNPPRHDPLTDLRYLHCLLWYRHEQPADTHFDSEIERYTLIVKKDFANPHNERGWIYDEFIHMWQLSHDEFFKDAARSEADYFAEKLYRPEIGAIYKTSDASPRGHYRVDLALETGCALVQAGALFDKPDWSAKGERLAQFVYAHAWLAPYQIFPSQMDNVLLSDGTANPNETFYREPYRNYELDGGEVRMGQSGQEALALLHVFLVTSNQVYLQRACGVLAPLTVENNLDGLWDTNDGGYFNGLKFPGVGYQNPGRPKLLNTSKESGRQFHLLQAFHLADALTQGKFKTTENALREVLLEKAYYSPGRGVLYEVKPDWSPRRLKSGGSADWVTTEAMDIVSEALLSLNEREPW